MKIEKGFVSQKIGDKTVLVRTDAKGGFCGIIELNDTAADIWECFEKGFSIKETAETLTKKYDVSYEKAEKSVDDVCQKLLESGVLSKD